MTVLTANEKVQINEDARVFCSWFRLVRNSAITRWNASGSFATCALHETRISLWVAKKVKTPQLANNWKSITRFLDNFVLLVVPGLSSLPAAVCLQHRDQRISKITSENWDYYQIQSRLEVTSMHAGNRCWQILTSRPRETVNQQTKKKTDEMYQEDPTQGIPDWLQPFTVNLEDLEMHVLAHSCERVNSDSEGDASKVELRKTGGQYSDSLPQIPKEIYHTNRRDWVTWKQ